MLLPIYGGVFRRQGRYPRQALTAENAAIPCDQVLGAYRVTFQR